MSTKVSTLDLLLNNYDLLVVAFIGGFVLFGLKMAAHFMKDPADKMSKLRYAIYLIFLLVCLPLLALIMTSVYIANGDQISPLLAFQVGLTSPAIAQSMIVVAANNMAKSHSNIPDD